MIMTLENGVPVSSLIMKTSDDSEIQSSHQNLISIINDVLYRNAKSTYIESVFLDTSRTNDLKEVAR